MIYCWLRYKTTLGAVVTARFRTTDDILIREDAGRAQETTLRATEIDHLTDWRYTYDLTISADQLFLTGAADFMRGFWLGVERYIALDVSTTTPDNSAFIAVTTPGGTAREFVEAVADLPEYTLQLREKYSRL